jgi:hypothetical protein
LQKFDHKIGFWEKRHFFAENCDDNIDPKSAYFLTYKLTIKVAQCHYSSSNVNKASLRIR